MLGFTRSTSALSRLAASVAHGPHGGSNIRSFAAAAAVGGQRGVVGVRREDKNKWERRVPLAPEHVKALVKDGVKVLVQPSTLRIFPDTAYIEAGASVQEDLSPASTILAVKEVPIPALMSDRTYLFFSHTIKGQQHNMPLLDAVLQKRIRLVDYECITEGGVRGAKRLVAFGGYAGIAGAIDFIRGLGERLLAKGFSTPFLSMGSMYMYHDIEAAKNAVRQLGAEIAKYGLPEALAPFTFVVTGNGNVSKGTQAILECLPVKRVPASQLANIVANAKGRDRTHTLYMAVADQEDMVRHKSRPDEPFNKKDYYANPTAYEPIFHEKVMPYTSVLFNCMYWEPNYPRLITTEQAKELIANNRWRCHGIGDITCDLHGSIEFLKEYSNIEAPFYMFDFDSETVVRDMDGPGVLYHAVDHLPSECPREASMEFGNKLVPFVKSLAMSDQSKPFEQQTDLPVEIRGATLAAQGSLTPNFQYIEKFRQAAMRSQSTSARAPAGKVSATLHVRGHLFDSGLINRILDFVEETHVSATLDRLTVGSDRSTPTAVSIKLQAPSASLMFTVTQRIKALCAEAGAQATNMTSPPNPATVVSPPAPKRVLLLGAGLVTPPVVEYLLRHPSNHVTVASALQHEAADLVKGLPNTTAVHLDVKDEGKVAELISDHDLVISLVPATMHVPIAKQAIQLRRHMVTASYISPEMAALDAEARKAGVVIMNEAGLDPGIDHMTAMRMIDRAHAEGKRVVSFTSLCGGLPAPEVADNPLGYKFSWSPRGAILAARNAAKFLRDGKVVQIPGDRLLTAAEPCYINPAFNLEVLPNRDSMHYQSLYNIREASSIFRGTLRYRGYSAMLYALAASGFLNVDNWGLAGQEMPLRSVVLKQLNLDANADDAKVFQTVLSAANKARGTPYSDAEARQLDRMLKWSGLLSTKPVKVAPTPIDMLVNTLTSKPEMFYSGSERDMALMHHELLTEDDQGRRELHVGTLVEYQTSSGTAMARTVGLTTAIAAQILLEGRVVMPGVRAPMTRDWYDPILEALHAEGITMKEKVVHP